MICPNCGNELAQDEVFCGQCGAQTLPSIRPTEMVQTPQAQSGLLNSGYNTVPVPGASYVPGVPGAQGMQPSANLTGALPPNAPASVPPGPRQQSGFYQDATEAISALPPMPGYPPSTGYSGAPVQGMYVPPSTQYGPPMQTGNYAGAQYPASSGYSPRPGLTPPPKQRSSAVMIIAIVCLGLAIISFGAFGVLYYVHSKNQPTAQVTPSPAITVTTVPSPTPSPSPSPTPSPSPSPSPSPTPTLSPTPSLPPADNGFVYCTDPCTTNGFITEIPQGWVQSTPDAATIIYNDPTQIDAYTIFRTPGATTDTASTLVTNDLNTYYASKPGFTITNSFNNRTIGGDNWSYEIVTYQNSGVIEQVEVYATVHNNNAFIIELQAPQTQYMTFDTSYFEYMLNRFQFQP